MPAASDDAEVIAFPDGLAFEAWLDDHVDLQAGVWLKLAKKGAGIPSLTDDEAVDIGLCYGWISGQLHAVEDLGGAVALRSPLGRYRWCS